MNHTYKLTGMTCNGCKANAESALKNLKEITKAEADLQNEMVELEMSSHVSLDKLQKALLDADLPYAITLPGEEKIVKPI